MNPLVAGALIGGAGNLLGRWVGGRQQRRNINRTNQANINLANLRYKNDMNMAEYAFDKNLEMWKLQNQYNSPQAQMQRFEDAGLNKHMIYGQGTPGNATGTPTYTPPSYQPPSLDYRGTPSEVANVLGSITGATKDLIELKNARETLAQSKIKTDIDNATKDAITERIKDERMITWFQKRIKNIEYTMDRYGVEDAPAMYKILVRHMFEEQMDESQMRKILSGIAVGKELVDILKAFGIGHLIGRGTKTVKKQPYRNY